MLAPCPHCGFLVALIVSRDSAAQLCPRCNHAIGEKGPPEAAPRTEAASRSAPAKAGPAEAAPMPLASPSQPTQPRSEADRDPGPAAPGQDNDSGPAEDDRGCDPAVAGATAEAATVAAPVSSTGSAGKAGPHRRGSRSLAPSFTRQRKMKPKRSAGWPPRAVIGILAVALLFQVLLAQRAQLAADARWRPTVSAVCGVLGCDLPPWHQPAAFTMLSRTVQPMVDHPGLLLVSASFRNDARWAQAWPKLELTLSNHNGLPVARRIFTAAEYRGAPPAYGLAPGQSAGVRFTVVEPSATSVAFRFDFH